MIFLGTLGSVHLKNPGSPFANGFHLRDTKKDISMRIAHSPPSVFSRIPGKQDSRHLQWASLVWTISELQMHCFCFAASVSRMRGVCGVSLKTDPILGAFVYILDHSCETMGFTIPQAGSSGFPSRNWTERGCSVSVWYAAQQYYSTQSDSSISISNLLEKSTTGCYR